MSDLKDKDKDKGKKDVNGKVVGYYDLPWKAISEVSTRLQSFKDFNGGKYPRGNERMPIKNTDFIDAIIRHALAYLEGNDLDENNTSHLAAIATNALLAEEQRLDKVLIENRLTKINLQDEVFNNNTRK